MENDIVPNEWMKAVIASLYENLESKKYYKNYRGMSQLSEVCSGTDFTRRIFEILVSEG